MLNVRCRVHKPISLTVKLNGDTRSSFLPCTTGRFSLIRSVPESDLDSNRPIGPREGGGVHVYNKHISPEFVDTTFSFFLFSWSIIVCYAHGPTVTPLKCISK